MSKYELDDHDISVILNDLSGHDSAMANEIADRIRAQIPIPVPVKIGAVVRAMEGGIPRTYLRWAYDSHTHEPWQLVNTDETFRTEDVGRITEVLSPGVDV